MSIFSRGCAWVRMLRNPGRLDADLDREIRDWVDELAARYEAGGMPTGAARRRALIETGGVVRVKEAVREVRVGAAVDAFLLDLRYAWRSLRRSRILTSVIVLTLALGVGANTAIFSLVHAILIAPLPYRDSRNVVFVWSDMSEVGYPRSPLSGPELADLRERSALFAGFGAIWAYTASLTGSGDPEQVRVGFVTTDFFAVLGADAALGRTFREDDATVAAPGAIVLSDALWRRRYGANPSIVGQQIHFDNRPATVVGVMQPGFRLHMPSDAGVPDDLQAWVPFWRTLVKGPRGQKFLRVVGRLHGGVALDEAAGELSAVASQISREFKEYGVGGRVFRVANLQRESVREIRPPLLALFGGVAILLAIACVNVASLLMARAAARAKETALLIALGANRVQLFRQCLAEGLTLAVLGGAVGLVSGKWALAALMALRPPSLDGLANARVDLNVLAFTSGLSMVWGVLFSLAPLWEVVRTDPNEELQHDGRRTVAHVGYRARAALVVGQIALSVVLLVSAGLLVRTFIALQRVDPGFRTESALTFRLALPFARYRTPEVVDAFGRQVQSGLAALPAVSHVGGVSHLPYDHLPNWGGPYVTTHGTDASTAPMADFRAVSPGLFEAIDATRVDGRFFTEADDRRAQQVVIVDERLAGRTWPSARAVGRHLVVDPNSTGHPDREVTVVGVVKHLGYRSPMADDREQVYFPVRQVLQNELTYVLRTSTDPAALAAQVRQVIAHLDPDLPVSEIRPFSEYRRNALAAQRFTTVLAATFAAVALLLACIGAYGVMAYAVARRYREFGVRLAFGARPRHVIGLVMSEGMKLAAAGLALGVVGALCAARLLHHQLFGVTPLDAPSYSIAVGALALAVVAACWLPARRAAARSPIDALRAE